MANSRLEFQSFHEGILNSPNSTDLASRVVAVEQTDFTEQEKAQCYYSAVEKDPVMLNLIPVQMRDIYICLRAVNQNPFVLTSVPDELLDRDESFNRALTWLCYLVQSTGDIRAFPCIPKSRRNLEVCLAAVDIDIRTLVDVPEAILDRKEFAEEIDRFRDEVINSLIDVREDAEKIEIKFEWDVGKKEEKKKPLVELKYCPARLLNQALCEEYVKTDISSLGDVPKNFRNYHLFELVQNQLVKIMPYLYDYKNNTMMTDDEYNRLLTGILVTNKAFDFVNAFSANMYYEKIIKYVSKPYLINPLLHFFEMRQVLTDERCKQVVLAAYQTNKIYLWDTPEELINLLDYGMCLEMVKYSSYFITSPSFLRYQFTHSQYKEMLMIAVKQDGNTLAYVFKEFRSYKLCLESVKQEGNAIRYIVGGQVDNLSAIQYQNLQLAAVKQNGMALKHIPAQEWDYELCRESINQNLAIIETIIKDWKNSKLTEDEYNQLCHMAAGLNGRVAKLFPKEQRHFDLMLKAVENAGIALQYAEVSLLTEDQYRQLCVAAVRSMPIALMYVPDKFKDDVVNEIGLEYLLIPNYAVASFLQPHNRDEQYRVLTTLLSNVVHIVVTQSDSFYDSEINDTYMVYANSKSRKGKTIHTDSNNFDTLMADINKYQDGSPQLNLVILGHANNNADTHSIAGLHVTQIRDLIADHPAIGRVTLLGCLSVSATQLEFEKQMTQKYQDTMKQQKALNSGLVLSYQLPGQAEYEKMFRLTDKDKNGGHPDKLYVYVNGTSEQKCVIELTKDAATQAISATRYDSLSDDSLKLLNSLSKGKKATTAQRNQIIYIRSGKSADNLNTEETAKLSAELEGVALRFSPAHPTYKEDKTMFPFLTGVEIDTSEEQKLMPSLTKTLVELIKEDNRIKREVVVKGYNKPLHVDVKEKQIKATRTHLYTSEYDKHYETFFAKSKDNIDRKKLAHDRKSEIESMAKDDKDSKSRLKSIKVRIKK